MSDSPALFKSIRELAESIHAINQRAVQQYTPIVEAILRTRSRDIRHIEWTLDGLLDFCGFPPCLLLYRRLCRHYFDTDPVATADYVNIYRKLWDSDPTELKTRPGRGGDRRSAAGSRAAATPGCSDLQGAARRRTGGAQASPDPGRSAGKA